MRSVIMRHRNIIGALVLLVACLALWIYWNRIVKADLSNYAPADSLGYIEVNDLAELARRLYRNAVFVRKQIQGTDLQEWQTADGTHAIVFTFIDTAVIVSNDETSVLRSIDARAGRRASLTGAGDLSTARLTLDSAN